jgi:predicted dehydrogenase
MMEPEPAYILHGTNGSFLKSRADNQERELVRGKLPNSTNWGHESERDYGLLHSRGEGGDNRQPIVSSVGNYMSFYDGMYTAITSDTDVPVSATDGIRVMRVIEAVIESNEKKRVVAFN